MWVLDLFSIGVYMTMLECSVACYMSYNELEAQSTITHLSGGVHSKGQWVERGTLLRHSGWAERPEHVTQRVHVAI